MFASLKDKEVVCRKRHRCAWCGQFIEIGEHAQYRAYIFEGFTTDYMHPECYQALCDYPDRRDLEDGWMEGDFKRGSCEPAC